MANGQTLDSLEMRLLTVFSREKGPYIADQGYRDQLYFEFANGDQRRQKILARHETVNSRIKMFCCMGQRFRHSLYLHPRFFHAVVNIIQLMIQNGEPLFTVDF